MYAIFEKLCRERGITPYRVSKDTGISTATLSDWKTGKSNPKADKIQRIADYFDVPAEYIQTGMYPIDINKDVINKAIKNIQIDRLLFEYISKFSNLNDDDKADIMNSIDFKLSRYKEKEKQDLA
jgi:transcriptional regulator with XRE-family HTH domain